MKFWDRKYTETLGVDTSKAPDSGINKTLQNRAAIVNLPYSQTMIRDGDFSAVHFSKNGFSHTIYSGEDIEFAGLYSATSYPSTGYWYWAGGYANKAGKPSGGSWLAQSYTGGEQAGAGWDTCGAPRPVPYSTTGLLSLSYFPYATNPLWLNAFRFDNKNTTGRYVDNSTIVPWTITPGAVYNGYESVSDLSYKRDTDYFGLVTTRDYSACGYYDDMGTLKLALFNFAVPKDYPTGDYWYDDTVSKLTACGATPTTTYEYAWTLDTGTNMIFPSRTIARYNHPIVEWMTASKALIVEIDQEAWPIHWPTGEPRLNPNHVARHQGDPANVADPYTPAASGIEPYLTSINVTSEFRDPYPYWGRIRRTDGDVVTEIGNLVPLLKTQWTPTKNYAEVRGSSVTLHSHGGVAYAVIGATIYSADISWVDHDGDPQSDRVDITYSNWLREQVVMIVEVGTLGSASVVHFNVETSAGGFQPSDSEARLVSSCVSKDADTMVVLLNNRSLLETTYYRSKLLYMQGGSVTATYVYEDPDPLPSRRRFGGHIYAAAHIEHVVGDKFALPYQVNNDVGNNPEGGKVGTIVLTVSGGSLVVSTNAGAVTKVRSAADVSYVVTGTDSGNALVRFKWESRYLWGSYHPTHVWE